MTRLAPCEARSHEARRDISDHACCQRRASRTVILSRRATTLRNAGSCGQADIERHAGDDLPQDDEGQVRRLSRLSRCPSPSCWLRGRLLRRIRSSCFVVSTNPAYGQGLFCRINAGLDNGNTCSEINTKSIVSFVPLLEPITLLSVRPNRCQSCVSNTRLKASS